MTLAPSDAAFEGFRIIRDRPGLILAWTGFYLASLLAMVMVLLIPNIGALTAIAPVRDRDFDQLFARFGPAFLVAMLLAMTMMTVLITAIFRAVLRPEESRWAGLRVGWDEARVFAVSVAVFFVFAVASAGFGLGVVVVGDIAPGLRGLLTVVGSAGGLALIVWLAVRFYLSGAQTFAEKRVALIGAWRLTHGQFWRLLWTVALSVVFALIVVTVAFTVSLVLARLLGGFSLLGELVNPDPGAITQGLALKLLGQLLLQLAIQALVIVLVLTIFYAAPAAAYRILKAPPAS
ncbi:MAG: hypothetical protein ACOY4K_14165 [Pseudomonadota bacterium]